MELVNPELNIAALKQTFNETGVVIVKNYFKACVAEQVYQCLNDNLPWGLHFNEGAEAIELSADDLRQVSTAEVRARLPTIPARVTTDFSYVFNKYNVVRAVQRGDAPALLKDIFDTFNQARYLNVIREITGLAGGNAMDLHAGQYLPGHFLTAHTDTSATETRLAAHIINFTKEWNTAWGGMLNFCDNWGRVLAQEAPTFNTLVLFKVPRLHYVSCVKEGAERPRHTLFGWYRQY